MNDNIANWKLCGRVSVWRYPPVRTAHQGWHFSAEPVACEKLVELLTFMRAGAEPTHRTISLSQPTPLISSVPGYGDRRNDKFEKLRIIYDPRFDDVQMHLVDGRLELRLGDKRYANILVSLADIQRGEGDFGLWPSETRASLPIWFWWMPWSGQSYPR